LIVLIGVFIAIPWQIEQLKWVFNQRRFDLFEWIPIVTAIIFTLGSVIIQIKSYKAELRFSKSNS
jgi:hypothetical protein